MQINNESSWLGPQQIKIIEEKYNAQYVCETPIKTVDGGWVNFPCAIFYTEEKHPEGSNYMALYKHPDTGQLYVCDGKSATQEPIVGVVADDGEVIFSRFRHDYRVSKDETATIDGGRDYVRSNAGSNLVSMSIVQGHLEIKRKLK